MENSRESAVLHGHKDVVLAVTFSPDGELVASTALSDRGVQLWDVQKKESRAILHGEVSAFTCMAFTQDSRTLVTGDEHGAVRLWDVGSLKQKTMIPAHEGWVKGLAVSSTGETLVTGGNDGLVKVWDLAEVSGDRRAVIGNALFRAPSWYGAQAGALTLAQRLGDLDLAGQAQPARDPRPLAGKQGEALPCQRAKQRMRQAVSPVAILLEREQAHDPRVAFAVNAPLVADDHEFLLGIARLAKAREEAPGQDRPGRDKAADG